MCWDDNSCNVPAVRDDLCLFSPDAAVSTTSRVLKTSVKCRRSGLFKLLEGGLLLLHSANTLRVGHT